MTGNCRLVSCGLGKAAATVSRAGAGREPECVVDSEFLVRVWHGVPLWFQAKDAS